MTEELSHAINILAHREHIAKNRLIEQLIRGAPEVSRVIQSLQLKNVTNCDGCNMVLKKGSTKHTTKFGVLCTNCFSEKLGHVLEEHPLVDPSELK